MADSQHIVSLYVDGEKRIVTTDAPSVGEVLRRTGIKLSQGDLVEPGGSTKLPAGFYNINIYRSRPVVVLDGKYTYRIQTARQSSRQIAADAGVTIYPEDQVDSGMVTDFISDGGVGNRLVITRALPVAIKVDGKIINLRTQAKTVKQLLVAKGIILGEADQVRPSLDSGIVPGLRIGVTRVAEAVVVTPKVLARPIQTVLDPNMSKGSSKIQQEGSDGHEVVTFKVQYRDGVETAREALNIDGHVDPSPRVIVQGTRVFFAGSVEYWRPFVTEAATAVSINPDLMLGIMRCESNGNANASNGSHFGLYQYDWTTWLSAGGSRDNVNEGEAQIKLTARKIAHEGTRAWDASKFCWSRYQ